MYIGARATARVDLDPQFYLQNASGEARPHLITDFVSNIVTDTEEISLGPGATLTLNSGTEPKLHAVSPAKWIAANARTRPTHSSAPFPLLLRGIISGGRQEGLCGR